MSYGFYISAKRFAENWAQGFGVKTEYQRTGGMARMFIERIDLAQIREKNWLDVLGQLQIGESVYCTDHREAESARVTSYYLIKTRNLDWKFVSRKMDRGWRLIRVR